MTPEGAQKVGTLLYEALKINALMLKNFSSG